jgi:hypothetical protein
MTVEQIKSEGKQYRDDDEHNSIQFNSLLFMC